MADLTWDFVTKTGEGGVDITVTVAYESDEHGIYNDSIEKITHENIDVTGIFCAEQFAELEMEASMKLRGHYLNLDGSDFGLL